MMAISADRKNARSSLIITEHNPLLREDATGMMDLVSQAWGRLQGCCSPALLIRNWYRSCGSDHECLQSILLRWGPRATIDWKSFGHKFQLSEWTIGKASIKWLGASKQLKKRINLFWWGTWSCSSRDKSWKYPIQCKKTNIISIPKKITRTPMTHSLSDDWSSERISSPWVQFQRHCIRSGCWTTKHN